MSYKMVGRTQKEEAMQQFEDTMKCNHGWMGMNEKLMQRKGEVKQRIGDEPKMLQGCSDRPSKNNKQGDRFDSIQA